MSFAVQGVRVAHPNGQIALASFTLAADQGEHIAVIGPSGAGKTTLLRVLAAGLRPQAGEVEVLASTLWSARPKALKQLRQRIGLIHQAPPLPPRQRVVTAVLAGRLGEWPLWKSLASLFYPLDIAGAAQALEPLGLADRLFDRCDQLSGGQLQRIGIGRVLYQSPDLLLADEPVSAMDPALADRTLAHLAAFARQRQATLVTSLHAVDLALRHFPRVVGIQAGRLMFDCPTREVTPDRLRALYGDEELTLSAPTGHLPMGGPDPEAAALSRASLCGRA